MSNSFVIIWPISWVNGSKSETNLSHEISQLIICHWFKINFVFLIFSRFWVIIWFWYNCSSLVQIGFFRFGPFGVRCWTSCFLGMTICNWLRIGNWISSRQRNFRLFQNSSWFNKRSTWLTRRSTICRFFNLSNIKLSGCTRYWTNLENMFQTTWCDISKYEQRLDSKIILRNTIKSKFRKFHSVFWIIIKNKVRNLNAWNLVVQTVTK